MTMFLTIILRMLAWGSLALACLGGVLLLIAAVVAVVGCLGFPAWYVTTEHTAVVIEPDELLVKLWI